MSKANFGSQELKASQVVNIWEGSCCDFESIIFWNSCVYKVESRQLELLTFKPRFPVMFNHSSLDKALS